MSLYKNIYELLTKTLPFLSNFSEHYDYDNDPYGVIEAAEFGEISDRLIECSRDKECPEYAQALFWIAADILSELNVSCDNTPNYDLDDPEFKRGLGLLQKAHNAGYSYASNELGLLHLEQIQMRDLELAENYFEKAFSKRDPISAYNLARVAHKKDPLNHKPVLDYLKFAAESKQEDYEISYFLALHAFGNHEDKSIAIKYIQKNKKACSILLNRFACHFNLDHSSISPNSHYRRLLRFLHTRFQRNKRH